MLRRLHSKFDILHVINAAPFFNLLAIPVAKKLNKRVILEMTLLGSDDPLTLSKNNREAKAQVYPHKPLKYRLVLNADAYVTKSRALSQAYYEAGLPPSKLIEIPAGVDVQKFRPPDSQEKESIRQLLGINPDGIVILYVGGIYKSKGVQQLLEAFQIVQKECSNVYLWIIGPTDRFETEYVRSIHEYPKLNNLEKWVSFVPKYVENVDTYMKASDIIAHPTRREGMSNVILEAMATGLAIVASDIPEIANVQIVNGREGVLFPVTDINQLASALANLVGNPVKRNSLGNAARKRVLEEFSQERIEKKYLALYQQVLDSENWVNSP